MKQLALGISPPPQPTLDNFVPGANAELLGRLRALRAGRYGESVLYRLGRRGLGQDPFAAELCGRRKNSRRCGKTG
jgi:DnaA family protein